MVVSSAFSVAAAIAFFHGAEYLERNKLTEAMFYSQWSAVSTICLPFFSAYAAPPPLPPPPPPPLPPPPPSRPAITPLLASDTVNRCQLVFVSQPPSKGHSRLRCSAQPQRLRDLRRVSVVVGVRDGSEKLRLRLRPSSARA